LRARPESTQLEDLSDASFLGKLLVLPANVRLDWKVFARYKHSSLFGLIVSNKEKWFCHIDTRSCDCRLRPLKEWLLSSNVPQTVEPMCATPPRLEGKRFAELAVDEFACPPDLLSAPRFVEANAGQYLSFNNKKINRFRNKNIFYHCYETAKLAQDG